MKTVLYHGTLVRDGSSLALCQPMRRLNALGNLSTEQLRANPYHEVHGLHCLFLNKYYIHNMGDQ